MKAALLYIGIIFFPFTLSAQLTYPGNPFPIEELPLQGVPVVNLECHRTTLNHPLSADPLIILKTTKVATNCPLGLTTENSGVWVTMDNGIKVWRIGLKAKEALSISLVFDEFALTPGARLFIYNPDQSMILGAYTHRNNREGNVFAIEPLSSPILYLELQLPAYLENPGLLRLDHVALFTKEDLQPGALRKDKYFGMSGPCNIDINCTDDEAILQQGHSVVRIVYSGVERCTGTLINNTRNNGHPYLLTASHCIPDQRTANTSIFYFNYESPSCYGSDGSVKLTLSGAKLLASHRDKLDFTLLELREMPPFFYRPLYTGWDVSNTPPEDAYSIHHPFGDVKKISYAKNPVLTSSYGYNPFTHWQVQEWESGTTEQGSSGAPLFDNNNRQVGILTGGSASCSSSYNDYFQKVFHCWADYPPRNHQLKAWLDPLSTGVTAWDAFDPFSGFWQTGDTVSNITAEVVPGVEYAGEWGYLAGHSSLNAKMFAERFSIQKVKYLMGFFVNPVIAYGIGEIAFSVYADGDFPGKEIYTKKVGVFDLHAGIPNYIHLDTLMKMETGFYIGYSIQYKDFDTFALAVGKSSSGTNTAFLYTDNHWKPFNVMEENQLAYSMDINPLMYDSLPLEIRPHIRLFEPEITIYPNPASDNLNVTFWEMPETDLHLTFYNISGQVAYTERVSPPDILWEYNLEKISPGFYVVQFFINNFKISKKLMVIKKR